MCGVLSRCSIDSGLLSEPLAASRRSGEVFQPGHTTSIEAGQRAVRAAPHGPAPLCSEPSLSSKTYQCVEPADDKRSVGLYKQTEPLPALQTPGLTWRRTNTHPSKPLMAGIAKPS